LVKVKEQRKNVKTQETQNCAKLRKLRFRAKNGVTDKVSMQKSWPILQLKHFHENEKDP